MIKFNDRFSFERDKYCWQLHEFYDGKDKHGKSKRQNKTTYHASLQQICSAIIDISCGECESISEIKHLLEDALNVLTKHAEDIALDEMGVNVICSMQWKRCSESMPATGRPVIAFVRCGATVTRRIRAQYAAEKTLEQSIECDGGVYDEDTDTYWVEPGWYETNEFEDVHWAVDGDVTHWMPLPDPPIDA